MFVIKCIYHKRKEVVSMQNYPGHDPNRNSPVCCHKCGLPLPPGSAFCSRCGAQQNIAPPPRAMAYAPAPNRLPLPGKEKISTPALLMAVAAMVLTAVAFFLYLINRTVGVYMRTDFRFIVRFMFRTEMMISACSGMALPLAAMITVLTKKKPIALIVLILTGVCFGFQIIGTVLYEPITRNQIPAFWGTRYFYYLINGETLAATLKLTGRYLSYKPNFIYFSMYFSPIFYFLKNILAAVSCLIALMKKK